MKNIALFGILLISIFSIPVFAQREAFLCFSVSGGVGGNLKESYNINYSGSTVGAFGLDLKAGYRFGSNIELITGLSFNKTGLSNKMEAVYPYNLSPYSERFTYYNVYVPLEIGYSLKVNERFRIIPSVSVGLSHLLAGKYLVETDFTYSQDLDRVTRIKNYNSIAVWAGAALLASYHLTDRWSLFGGYRYNGMLKSFTKSSFAPNSDQQQLLVVSGELGIRCKLSN